MRTSHESRRQIVLERLTDHILSVGLAGTSLRPLAAAVGTSDRMLLYYFADKDELLGAALGLAAQRLLSLLDGSFPGRHRHDILLPRLAALVVSPLIKPYMRLWLEITAAAARGQEPFLGIAGRLSDGFLDWIAASLEVDREEERPAVAALLLSTLEGMILLDAIERGETVRAALAADTLQGSRSR